MSVDINSSLWYTYTYIAKDKVKIRYIKMRGRNSIIKNVAFGFGSKVIVIALGIILPKLMIESFGSEINGLLTTVTQIYTYVALLEAGIGTAAVNALYRPLDKGDRNAVINVVSAARRYFHEVTYLYFGAVVLFAVIYPWCVSADIDKMTIFWVIMIQGMSGCVSYYFCAVYNQLLEADAHRYVTENVELCGYVLTSIAKILLVSAGFNVIAVQIANFVLAIVKVLITYAYCKKKYPWITYRKNADKNLLEQRGAFVIHEISTAIFSNTDVVIISLFDLGLVSVYGVYNLVFTSLNTLINTVNAGLGFLLGQNHYKDRKKFLLLYDTYDTVYTGMVFVIFSIAYVLTLPFMSLYAVDFKDENYIISYLPLLFTLINLMSGTRMVASRLINVTGYARKTQVRSIAEAVINIVASLILVQFFDIYGVLAGTIIALLYRMNDMLIFANRRILKRRVIEGYKNLLVNGVVFAVIVVINEQITLHVDNYGSLVLLGIVVSLIIAAVYLLVNCLCNIRLLKNIKIVLQERKVAQATGLVPQKIYVEVTAKFDVEGNITPVSVRWEDGSVYEIDEILDASQRATGNTDGRYICMIHGQERHLCFENSRWFVEESLP